MRKKKHYFRNQFKHPNNFFMTGKGTLLVPRSLENYFNLRWDCLFSSYITKCPDLQKRMKVAYENKASFETLENLKKEYGDKWDTVGVHDWCMVLDDNGKRWIKVDGKLVVQM